MFLLDLLLLGGRLGGGRSSAGLLLLVEGILTLAVLAGLLGVDPGGVRVLEPDRIDNVDDIDDCGQDEARNGLLADGHGQEVEGGSQVHRVWTPRRIFVSTQV